MLSALGSCSPLSSSANTFHSVSGSRHSLDKNKYVHKHIRNKRCSSCVVHAISNTLLVWRASCVVRFVQEAPHARHLQSTAGVLGEKVSIGDNGSGRVREKQRRLERVRLHFDGERRVVGIKALSGESSRIVRRINCLRLSPIEDFLPSERPAVCSKGRKVTYNFLRTLTAA